MSKASAFGSQRSSSFAGAHIVTHSQQRWRLTRKQCECSVVLCAKAMPTVDGRGLIHHRRLVARCILSPNQRMSNSVHIVCRVCRAAVAS